ncbi:UDP-N-acetylglucosamine 1-carboxyvinyltransferase [Phycisphaera mikurensis]|uniref:UDP-N-acetylglucosamine 1-carboxyvinyltransferase n=1 Tax=Phycisphaera mikurensis (strain NBRC 102666 / KCTC 22515 / FYK2301M01) TaxID=1142394 RepID=I0IIA6_PHYMF|nr:UDP-N-acetylglucosamine 1-carboxyvinyltransferase [Phycisphaera mikurensis]MBB6442443.1 UDP-N-acetylglucosamine 1-carboxyvinyltransferase [Phycisphaera mikurensis]BAM04994.1 UDP-N-acetylglucosamine 1-carboxyvinyltransferase [Phycisphaera mikurensis NBRC 102666]
MDAFEITGGRPLRGEVTIQGAKNAALPLMAAALLAGGDTPVTLRNVPDLSDIRSMLKLLAELGLELTRDTGGTLSSAPSASDKVLAPYDIVKTMRAGICVLGPLLAKRGRAEVSMPGGCAIGTRPVDLHLRGLEALGARITLDAGYIVAEAPPARGGGRRLRGAHVFLGGPNGSTVLGTANVMSAAVLAAGTTVIECAACEPEIEDLGKMLVGMGAEIEGLGSPRVTVHGVDELAGVDHAVMPDRIEAGTYLAAAAATGGDVAIHRFPVRAMGAFLAALRDVGVRLEEVDGGSADRELNDAETATVRGVIPRRLDPTAVVTQPHPGFPTDLQAQLMALLCLADGNSLVTEKIFPDRFLHVPELQRMGADVTRLGPSAMVRGVRELIGAPVMASDLRASAGLVIAGLAARGTTLVQRVYHLDRGYEAMETRLQALGADIQRVRR